MPRQPPVYVCMYVCMYVNMISQVCMYVYICICMCVYMYLSKFVCLSLNVLYVCMYVRMNYYVHVLSFFLNMYVCMQGAWVMFTIAGRLE